MAKTAKLKKNPKSVSIHSRAAKRASSPSMNLDKSITSLPSSSTRRPTALGIQNGGGIMKRKGKGKNLTRHQRLRQEKGMERAETVLDKREKKVERSVGKGKAMKQRNVAWEELNWKGLGGPKKRKVDGTTSKDHGWEVDEAMSGISEADSKGPVHVDSDPTEGDNKGEDETSMDEIL